MIALLTNLFRAAAALLELRLLRGRWELMRDIEDYHEKREREIERLRNLRTTDGNLAADRLAARVLRMQSVTARIQANLSAGGTGAAAGSAGADNRGSLPTAVR